MDHLGTVRDLVEYVSFAAGGSRTILQKHRTYDSFGNVLSEYNRGDFDGDGDFDATDIDMLFQFVAAGSFGQYNGVDVNGDGAINAADIDAFIWDVIGTVYGDADMDGVCDVSDLNVWNANKFQTGDFGWAQADFNGDNVVDTADWNIWNANKFTGTAGQLNTAVLDHIFGFTGRMFDEVTNLQNNLNRWYDAAVGRWVSEDPIPNPFVDRSNIALYVNNKIVGGVDPSGLFLLAAFPPDLRYPDTVDGYMWQVDFRTDDNDFLPIESIVVQRIVVESFEDYPEGSGIPDESFFQIFYEAFMDDQPGQPIQEVFRDTFSHFGPAWDGEKGWDYSYGEAYVFTPQDALYSRVKADIALWPNNVPAAGAAPSTRTRPIWFPRGRRGLLFHSAYYEYDNTDMNETEELEVSIGGGIPHLTRTRVRLS